MLYPTLTLNLVIIAGLAILFNLAALIAILALRKGRSIRDNPSLVPLLCLLFIDFGLSVMLAVPFYSFLSEEPFFDWTSCQIYGGLDMALSLSQFLLACLIAFDRYVASLAPKWGQWRRHSNYLKAIVVSCGLAGLWSVVPVLGYGSYDTFLDGHFCSLDWKQVGALRNVKAAVPGVLNGRRYEGTVGIQPVIFRCGTQGALAWRNQYGAGRWYPRLRRTGSGPHPWCSPEPADPGDSPDGTAEEQHESDDIDNAAEGRDLQKGFRSTVTAPADCVGWVAGLASV